MATIKISIRKNKIDKNGYTAVQIVLCHEQKTAYISTGIKVPFANFDNEKYVDSTVENHKEINTQISILYNQYYSIFLLHLPNIKNISIKELKQKIQGEWERLYAPHTKSIPQKKKATSKKNPIKNEQKKNASTQEIKTCGSYVRLFRNIDSNYWDMWHDTKATIVFFWLITNANYQPSILPDGRNIKRGQILASVFRIKEAFKNKLSDKEIRGAIERLIKANKISKDGKTGANEKANERANKSTIITICNYDIYNGAIKEQGQMKGQTEDTEKGNINIDINNKYKITEYHEQMKKHCPNLLNMKNPLSYEQYHKLVKDYGYDATMEAIKHVNSVKSNNVTSAFVAIRKYIKNEQ